MNRIAVIKFGGHCIEEPNNINTLIQNIKYLKKNNYSVILVHGGTPSVNEKLEEKHIPSRFVNGYRITTKEIMGVVQEAILGKEVINIIKILNMNEIPAVALNGTDASLIKCIKKDDSDYDYGYVGKILNINTQLLDILIDNNIVPVISPIGCDDIGNSYNINSDYLASCIATSISADWLFMVSNVNGIYMDIKDEYSRIPVIDEPSIKKLIKSNIITSVMETKVNACLDYSRSSGTASYIISANQLIDFNTLNSKEYGTKIISQNNEVEIRFACNSDIDELIKIIKKSFIRYQNKIDYIIGPIREDAEDLIYDIKNKLVFVMSKNNSIIGTIRLSPYGNICRFSRICIKDEFQNQGYGSKLLDFAEKYAFYKGFSCAGLTSLYDVDYLDAFYKKNGYELNASNSSRGYMRSLFIKDLGINHNKINEKLFM